MKTLFLALLFTFCLEIKGRDNVWEAKCSTNAVGNPNALTELIRAEKYMPKCILDIMEPITSNQTADLYKFCQPDGLTTGSECMQDYTRKFALCLSDEEDFLEDLILSTYGNMVDDFCAETSFSMVSSFLIKFQNDEYKWRSFTSAFSSCLQNTNTYKMITAEVDVNFKLQEFCSDLNSLTSCLKSEFAASSFLSDLSETLKKMTPTFLRWCKKNNTL